MTGLVLLVLAVIWVVALATPLVRARAEGTLGDSIGSFRRHLSVLERAGPTTVSPANRLKIPNGQVAIPPYRPPAASMRRPAPSGRQLIAPPTRRVSAGFPTAGYTAAGTSAVLSRRRAQKRRRDVLFALTAGVFGSLILGLIPGLSVMLWVFVFLVALFVGYLLLLVRMRNVAAEREMKLTFLPAVAAPVPTYPAQGSYGPYGEPERSEGYGQVAAGYGSLLARQSAH